MQKIQVGEPHQIIINNSCSDAKVKEIKQIENDETPGYFIIFEIDGYGETQGYFYPGTDVTSVGFQKRSKRSMMPTEFTYKKAGDINWPAYEEDVTPQKKIMNAFVLNFDEFKKIGKGLYISSGTTGAGKTLIACVLANEILKRYDISVKFITPSDYAEIIKDKSAEGMDKQQKIKDAGLLILDDIGNKDNERSWVDDQIDCLIDYRERRMLPIIYTSLYPADKLPGDKQIVDRVIANSIELKIPEKNIRRKIAKERNDQFITSILNDNNGLEIL